MCNAITTRTVLLKSIPPQKIYIFQGMLDNAINITFKCGQNKSPVSGQNMFGDAFF